MVNYEGVFIINPDITADAAKGVVTQVQDFVSKNGGRIDNVQEWGKRRLAYKVNKKQEGNYVILNFQLDSAFTKKFEQSIRLNDNVMRYLLVNKDLI